MFGPPHRISPLQPSTRIMWQTTQTTLDSLCHKAKPKTDSISNVQLEGGDSPSSTRMTMGCDTSAQDNTAKKLTKIHTPAEARACLQDTQLIEPDDDTLAPDMLVGALVHISLFPGLSQAARDATCSVALLLAQTMLVVNGEAVAEGLLEHMMGKLAEVVKEVTLAAITEVKSASLTLTKSSTQIAATAISYRDALKSTATSSTTSAAMLDARVRVWEGIKAWQILVDVSSPGQQLHQGANNVQLVLLANDMLKGMEDPPSHRFIGPGGSTMAGCCSKWTARMLHHGLADLPPGPPSWAISHLTPPSSLACIPWWFNSYHFISSRMTAMSFAHWRSLMGSHECLLTGPLDQAAILQGGRADMRACACCHDPPQGCEQDTH